MIDILIHLLHACASCVADNNVLPPAVGALTGGAAAAGGLGGLGGLGNGPAHAGPSNNSPESSTDGPTPPSSHGPVSPSDISPPPRPVPIGDTGAKPDHSAPGLDPWVYNKDGSITTVNPTTGERSTQVAGGPMPVDGETIPGPNSPVPIGDTGAPPDHSAPDMDPWVYNKDGSITTVNPTTGERSTQVAGGPMPVDGETIPDPDSPVPIGDTGAPPDHSAPDMDPWVYNKDGSITTVNPTTGERSTQVAGGPMPVDGETIPEPGAPTNIGPIQDPSSASTQVTDATAPPASVPTADSSAPNSAAATPASTTDPLNDRTVSLDPDKPTAPASTDGPFEPGPLDTSSPLGTSQFAQTASTDYATPAPATPAHDAGAPSAPASASVSVTGKSPPHRPH